MFTKDNSMVPIVLFSQAISGCIPWLALFWRYEVNVKQDSGCDEDTDDDTWIHGSLFPVVFTGFCGLVLATQ